MPTLAPCPCPPVLCMRPAPRRRLPPAGRGVCHPRLVHDERTPRDGTPGAPREGPAWRPRPGPWSLRSFTARSPGCHSHCRGPIRKRPAREGPRPPRPAYGHSRVGGVRAAGPMAAAARKAWSDPASPSRRGHGPSVVRQVEVEYAEEAPRVGSPPVSRRALQSVSSAAGPHLPRCPDQRGQACRRAHPAHGSPLVCLCGRRRGGHQRL